MKNAFPTWMNKLIPWSAVNSLTQRILKIKEPKLLNILPRSRILELVANQDWQKPTRCIISSGTLPMKNLGSKKRNCWLDLMTMEEIWMEFTTWRKSISGWSKRFITMNLQLNPFKCLDKLWLKPQSMEVKRLFKDWTLWPLHGMNWRKSAKQDLASLKSQLLIKSFWLELKKKKHGSQKNNNFWQSQT